MDEYGHYRAACSSVDKDIYLVFGGVTATCCFYLFFEGLGDFLFLWSHTVAINIFHKTHQC